MTQLKVTAPSVKRFPTYRRAGCGKRRLIVFLRPSLRKLEARRRVIERNIRIANRYTKFGAPFLSFWDTERRKLFAYLINLKRFCEHTTSLTPAPTIPLRKS
jgi:hypothetical protein